MYDPDNEPIPIVPSSQPVAPPPKRRWLPVAILVALLVIAAVAACMLTMTPKQRAQVAATPPVADSPPTPDRPMTGGAGAGIGTSVPDFGGGNTEAAPQADMGSGSEPEATSAPSAEREAQASPSSRTLDVPTHLADHELLVGVRAALEADGWTVEWLGGGRAKCWNGSSGALDVTAGQDAVVIDGARQAIPSPAVVADDHLFVPPVTLEGASHGRLSVDKATGKVVLNGQAEPPYTQH